MAKQVWTVCVDAAMNAYIFGEQPSIVEIEFPLSGWTFSTQTNIAKRKLCNRDACLLLLAANGLTVKTSTLKTLLRAWRPLEGITYLWQGGTSRLGKRELDFAYLFNAYYGHVSKKPDGVPYKPYFGNVRKLRGQCYWWSSKRGEVQISAAGYARLEQLRMDMSVYHNEVMSCVDRALGLRSMNGAWR